MIIALIIFGPNDIVRAGRSLGRFLRKVVTSEGWQAFQQASKGMRDLPNTLMREAGLEEEDLRELSGMKDFEEATRGLENQISPWTTPPIKQPDNQTGQDETLPSEDTSHTENVTFSAEQNRNPISKEPPAPPPGSPFSQTIDGDN